MNCSQQMHHAIAFNTDPVSLRSQRCSDTCHMLKADCGCSDNQSINIGMPSCSAENQTSRFVTMMCHAYPDIMRL